MKRGYVIAWAAGAVLVAVYLYRKRQAVAGILMVFAFAAVFALLLSPACRALEKRGMRSSWAAAVTVFGFLLLLLLLLSAFVPYLIVHSAELIRRNAPTLLSILRQLGQLLQRMGMQGVGDLGSGNALAGVVSRVTAAAARGSMAIAAQAGQLFFALVVSYYLLTQRKRIGNELLLIVPLHRRASVLAALQACRNAAMGYLCGMFKTSVFIGAATYVGLKFLNVQDAFLLALFMGLFEILPYVGPVLASVPILLSCLPQGIDHALLALALLIFVQQLEGNFISPYFTASSTSIHPFAALVSVFVMGSLMGIWGILLAVPMVVLFRSVLWSLRQVRYAQA